METHFVFPWNSILYFHGHTIPANICTQLMKWYQIVLENEDKCFAGLTFSSRGGGRAIQLEVHIRLYLTK